MVSQALSLETRGNLRQNGYRMETTHGWDTHEVPLYVHRPGAIRQVGEVGFKMRVGNLRRMDQAEAQYLARKGAQGFFTWKPEECFKHEFTPVEVKARPGGGLIVEKSDRKVYGCKWCRDAMLKNGLPGDVKPASSTLVESTSEITSTPPAVANGISCTIGDCDFATKSVDKSGKQLSEAKMLHSLSLHTKRKHA